MTSERGGTGVRSVMFLKSALLVTFFVAYNIVSYIQDC